MSKKYILKLTTEERADPDRLVRKGNAAGWKLQRARALLKCDQGPEGPAWPDAKIAEAFGVTTRSLESWRERAVLDGPSALLQRKPRTPTSAPKLGGESEARLTALACSQPPRGLRRWSLRLLAERLVELEVVAAVSHEAVRRALKKADWSRGGGRCGASRRGRTRPSSARWSRCWRPTGAPTTRGGRSSAWASSPGS